MGVVLASIVALFFLTFYASFKFHSDRFLRIQDRNESLRASPLDGKEIKRGSSPTILFVVNTHSANIPTRVRDIRNTYLERIRAKSSLDLIFVSSQTSDGSPDIFVSTCPEGYWEDSCKRADMMTFAGEYLRRPGKEAVDWIYFMDDDAYILPDNIQRKIKWLVDSGLNLRAIFGLDVCNYEECKGICGGGGYFMNRESMFSVIEGGDKTRFQTLRDETQFYDEKCGRAGDLTISRAVEDFHGIPITTFPFGGIYIWEWDLDGRGDIGVVTTLQKNDPLPLLYHYPARDKFPKVHQWVNDFGSNKQLDD